MAEFHSAFGARDRGPGPGAIWGPGPGARGRGPGSGSGAPGSGVGRESRTDSGRSKILMNGEFPHNYCLIARPWALAPRPRSPGPGPPDPAPEVPATGPGARAPSPGPRPPATARGPGAEVQALGPWAGWRAPGFGLRPRAVGPGPESSYRADRIPIQRGWKRLGPGARGPGLVPRARMPPAPPPSSLAEAQFGVPASSTRNLVIIESGKQVPTLPCDYFWPFCQPPPHPLWGPQEL